MNSFDYTATKYEQWFQKNHELFKSELKAIQDLIEENLGEALEIGVGTGVFAEALNIKEGIEPSKEMAKYALARGINVTISGIEEFKTEKKYNSIFMITVDPFIKNLERVFKKIHNMLTNSGCIYLVILDRETSLGKTYDKNKENDENYKYANFHSFVEVKKMLSKQFNIEKVEQTIFKLDNQYQEPIDGHGEGIFVPLEQGGRNESKFSNSDSARYGR